VFGTVQGGCDVAEVVLDRICKTYGNNYHAIKDLSLTIHDGEFLILVGPSGCGKSTALRMIAGLEEITSGTLSIGDQDVADLPPKDRDIAMVFQSYALYPHMTVFDNIAFSMKLAGKSKAERAKRGKRDRQNPAARNAAAEQAGAALRRSAPACGDGSGDGARTRGLPDG
jgi:multiple sugar transport system ATP-binding protein